MDEELRTDIETLADVVAQRVVDKLDTLPKELKEIVRSGSQYAMPIPTNTPANYALLKVICDPDGLWVFFEVNNCRLYERKFFYSDEYAYPVRHQRR